MLMAQGADTPPCPALAMPGRLTGSVEYRGDRFVRHLASQGANQVDHFRVGSPPRLAGAVPLHHQTGMVTALPVDDQLQVIADDIDDDLGDDRADDLLARLWRGAGALPSTNQVLTERHEPLAVGLGQRRRLVGIELMHLEFKITNCSQPFVPSPLQFSSYKAILRIGGVVLTLRPGSLVTRLLQR